MSNELPSGIPNDISPELDHALALAAADLSADRGTEVSFYESWGWANLLGGKVIESLNKHTLAASGGRYRVESVDRSVVNYEVFGPAFYCRRVDTTTGAIRYLFVGPYMPGFQYIRSRPI